MFIFFATKRGRFFFNVSKEEQSDYIIDGAVESEIAGSVYSFRGDSWFLKNFPKCDSFLRI